jgi:hypothetical protein
MLQKMGAFAKFLIRLGLVVDLGWLVYWSGIGIATLVYVVTRRAYGEVPSVLADMVGSVLLVAFAGWIYFDVTKSVKAVRQRRQLRESRDSHDGDVAGTVRGADPIE